MIVVGGMPELYGRRLEWYEPDPYAWESDPNRVYGSMNPDLFTLRATQDGIKRLVEHMEGDYQSREPSQATAAS